ncbi:hypothetical protein SOCE836_074630 [Sorangium cellulosum]|uniref:Uncharacterized protein n=1 Tax=Sorangium cellulosum TaxID=56 RepID=A0A4P2R075_SORCE|nr:hypothetical protein SOCE836_074630 [Sorangium cellulosum]
MCAGRDGDVVEEFDDTCRKRCGGRAISLCLGGAFLGWPALVGRVERPFATHAKLQSAVPSRRSSHEAP